MKKEINSDKINHRFVFEVARTIVDIADGIDMKDALSFYQGMAVAIVAYTRILYNNIGPDADADSLEKLFLSWLTVKPNFSKYININKQ